MKKIIIAVAALAVSISSFAQVSVGAGYLNSSATQVTTISEGTTNTANAFFHPDVTQRKNRKRRQTKRKTQLL